jgi:hypothetical protein
MASNRHSVLSSAALISLPTPPIRSIGRSSLDIQQTSKPKLSLLDATDVDRTAVEKQLARILLSHYFRNSERYTGFLRFVVDATLQEQTDLLKERLVGINVFGRDPSYDTLTDNVVRIAAAEVRSRLVRYYAQPEHVSELRIVMSPGSYVPKFARADSVPPADVELHNSNSLLHRFWEPLIEATEPILIVLGPCRSANAKKSLSDNAPLGNECSQLSEQISLSDALNLASIVSWIKTCGKDYRVEMQDFVRPRDLRNGPVILLGGFNNQWTLTFAASLRFAFKSNRENSKTWIRDSEDPSQQEWMHDVTVHQRRMTEDYAIVARILHSETGQPMLIAGGHTMYGTAAAGEFLTGASHLEEFASVNEDWESKDVEVVLSTNIIRGISGPPRIKATHVW